MRKIFIPTTLSLCLISIAQSATIAQTFSNNSVGSITDGSLVTLGTTPVFSASEVASATALEISLSLAGDAHKFIQNLSAFGSGRPAELFVSINFASASNAPITFDFDSLTQEAMDEDPSVPGFGAGDTSSLYDNPLSYTTSWTITDASLISAINGTNFDIEFTPVIDLGTDAAFAQDVLALVEYSNLRLDDVSMSATYSLTTVPEPSSIFLLSGGLCALAMRRRR